MLSTLSAAARLICVDGCDVLIVPECGWRVRGCVHGGSGRRSALLRLFDLDGMRMWMSVRQLTNAKTHTHTTSPNTPVDEELSLLQSHVDINLNYKLANRQQFLRAVHDCSSRYHLCLYVVGGWGPGGRGVGVISHPVESTAYTIAAVDVYTIAAVHVHTIAAVDVYTNAAVDAGDRQAKRRSLTHCALAAFSSNTLRVLSLKTNLIPS